MYVMWQYLSPPTPNELKHYGILGMKWGVRRFQNKDGTLTSEGKRRYRKKSNFDPDDIVLKKGTIVNRVVPKGWASKELGLTGHAYAAFKKEDIETYRRYASLFGKNSYVNLEYKVKDILVSPGEKKRVDEFVKLMSKDKQALETFKKSAPLLFIPKKRLENLTDPKDINRAYRRFSYLLVAKPELREAYFNQLKKDGYNMVIDDGDRLAKISSSPIIIFDREKSLTTPKIKKPS